MRCVVKLVTHLEVKEDGTIDITWHDVHRVSTVLGFIQIPNHTKGVLTYMDRSISIKFTLPKEEKGYNVDYFHNIILRILGINVQSFLRIAFGVQDRR